MSVYIILLITYFLISFLVNLSYSLKISSFSSESILKVVALWWFSSIDLSLYFNANFELEFYSNMFSLPVWSISWHNPENTKQNYSMGVRLKCLLWANTKHPLITVTPCKKLWNELFLLL